MCIPCAFDFRSGSTSATTAVTLVAPRPGLLRRGCCGGILTGPTCGASRLSALSLIPPLSVQTHPGLGLALGQDSKEEGLGDTHLTPSGIAAVFSHQGCASDVLMLIGTRSLVSHSGCNGLGLFWETVLVLKFDSSD